MAINNNIEKGNKFVQVGLTIILRPGLGMKSKKTILYLLFGSLMACGNHDIASNLDVAESLVQERPDSALSIINTIDTLSLKSKAIRARYSLLYAMALDKNFIDTTDLSVILPASNYYAKQGSLTNRMRAYYYQGRIYANRKEDDRAMHYYLMALEDSSEVADDHYKELVNSAISDVFSRSYNADQELKYTVDALRYGRLAKDSVGVWAITGHLASCYANLRQWEDAEKAFQQFFEMPIYDSLVFNRRKISYAKCLLLRPYPDPHKSVGIIETIVKECPESMTTESYCVYAYALQQTGRSSSADGIIGQLESLKNQQEILSVWRYRISREQQRFEQAICDLEQSVKVRDSIVFSVLRESMLQSQRDYLSAETRALKKENELEKQRSIILIILSLFGLSLTAFIFSKRNVALNKRIEELSTLKEESKRMLDLQNAKTAVYDTQIAEKDAALIILRKRFASMYKAQYKTLNDLCAAYLSPIKKDRKEIVYDEVMNQLKYIINDEESQSKFMSLVDGSLNGILEKLRKDLPNHPESDFRFLMYIIIGFEAKTISSLTGYSIGTVYTKKNRLKNEISRLSSPNRPLYLEYIV